MSTRATSEVVDRVARWLYDRDSELGPMNTDSWEHACAIGFDKGYRVNAEELLAFIATDPTATAGTP